MGRVSLTIIVTVIGSIFLDSSSLNAEEKKPFAPLNLRLKTLGGKQVWSDVRIIQDWRIQRNVYTGHHRLLSPNNYREAWGSRDHCDQMMDQQIQEHGLEPYRQTVVVLLHGILRARSSMDDMKHFLQRFGHQVISVSYASSRESIDDHARTLHDILDDHKEIDRIHVVAHSMGALVIRRYMKMFDEPRIKRIVMLGPPNHGSSLARMFEDNTIFQIFWGINGKEMASNWKKYEPRLLTPNCEFGILAGDVSKQRVRNPLFDEPNDLVVTVKETLLGGASDFRTVPVIHTYLVNNIITMKMTHRFLKDGYFETESARRRIAP